MRLFVLVLVLGVKYSHVNQEQTYAIGDERCKRILKSAKSGCEARNVQGGTRAENWMAVGMSRSRQ